MAQEASTKFYRYTILMLISLVNFVIYYCMELPCGLQDTIVRLFKINSKQYNLLFLSSRLPYVILCTILSFLIDTVIGIRNGLVLSTFVLSLGMAIFVAGPFVKSFIVLVVGRFVVGVGIGCILAVTNTFLSVWFEDNITFAMGIMFACCRLGAASGIIGPRYLYDYINFHLLPTHPNSFNMGLTVITGFLLTLASLLFSVAIHVLDSKGVGHGIRKSAGNQIIISACSFKDFSSKFWLSSISVALYYSAFFVYVANGQMFLASKFGFSSQQANIVNFLAFASPVLLTPFNGYLIQKTGYNIHWGLFGTLLSILTHVLFSISNKEPKILPYSITILYAFSFSFFGISIVPLPSMIVPSHKVTTAYGVSNMIYTIVFALTSLATGAIIDSVGYMWLEMFFCFIVYFNLIILVILAILDKVSDAEKINKPGVWIQWGREYWKSRRFRKSYEVIT